MIFKQILQDLEHCTVLEMHAREKLPKPKLASDIEESANRILNEHLHGDENIPEITDKVYAMGKAIGIKSEQRETNSCRKNKRTYAKFSKKLILIKTNLSPSIEKG